MIDKRRVRTLSELLLHAHYGGSPVAIDPALFPGSADEAYWVQEVVLRGLDPRRPKAWKVSPPRDGVESYASPTPFKGLQVSPAEFHGSHRVLGVEAEIAFRFAAAPAPKAKRQDIERVVEEAFVLIELCESRYANWDQANAFCRLADFQSHGGFALGTGTRNWLPIDFSAQRVELGINGKPVVSGEGSHPSGDPFALVAWAASHCAARGMPLAAGDIVTTGTWTGLTAIAPGDEIVARFDGVGEARLRVPA
jgi:2-keto-4-pentenoate hydratase